jgi:hypothetical protein
LRVLLYLKIREHQEHMGDVSTDGWRIMLTIKGIVVAVGNSMHDASQAGWQAGVH